MSFSIGNMDVGVAFVGDVSGLSGATGQAGAAIDNFGRKSTSTLRDVESQASKTDDSMQRLANGIKGAFVGSSLAVGIITLKNSLLDMSGAIVGAQVQLDKLRNGFSFGAGGKEGGARELGFVRDEADRLGLSLGSAAQQYMKMVAAARGTQMEGEKTRQIFISVAEAATVMGMSGEQSDRAMMAVVQMMSKGKVMAEELRGQLGEHLPGAFSIAARSMGVTEVQLNKLLETGQVLSADFLPKFADQLRKELGGSVEDATKSMQASLNRFETAWLVFKQSVAQSGAGDALGSVIRAGSNDLMAMSNVMDQARDSGKGFLRQMNDVAGLVIARSSIGFVEAAAETLNGTLNLVSLGALKLSTNIDLMPTAFKTAAQQAAELDGRLQAAKTEYEALALQLEKDPSKNIYLKSETHQAFLLYQQLVAAKQAMDALRPASEYSHEGRREASRQGDAALRAQWLDNRDKLLSSIASPAQKLTAELEKQKKLLGNLFTPEIERQITDYYAKPSAKAAKERGDEFASQREAAKEWAKYMGEFAKATADADAKALGLTKTQEKLVEYLQSTGYQSMDEPARQLALAEAYAAIQGEQLAETLKKQYAAMQVADKAAVAYAASLDKIALADADVIEMASAYTDTIAERVKAAEYEAGLIGLSNTERAIALKQYQIEIDLQKQILDIKKKMASATEQADAISAVTAAAQKAKANAAAEVVNAEFQRVSQQIEQDLTDALMRGFESGKGFAEVLRDTVANMFKTLVLRPVVQAIVQPMAGSITGALGLGGTGGASSSLLGSMAGNYATSALGSAVFGNSAAYGAALGTTSIGAGSQAAMLAAQTGEFGLAGLSATSGAAGGAMTSVGTALPYIGAALAVASLINSLDDSGTPHTGGYGAYSATGGALSGAALRDAPGSPFGLGDGDITAAANQASVDIAKSIVTMLDSTAATFGRDAGYYAATAFADDSSKDGAWGSLAIKLGDRMLLDWADTQTSRWAPKEFADGAAGVQQYAAAVSVSIRDLLIEQTPAWADTMLTALGSAPTIDQLAATVGQINQVQAALEAMGQASEAFAGLSEAATSAMIAAMGGAEASMASLSAYYSNFYTESERASLATAQVTAQLADLGQAMPDTREAFRAMVDAAVAAGDTNLAAKLLALSPALASVTKSTEELTAQLAAQAEKAAQEIASAAASLGAAFKDLLQPLLDGISGARDQVAASVGSVAGVQLKSLKQIKDEVAAQSITLPSSASVVSAKSTVDAAYKALAAKDAAVAAAQGPATTASNALTTANNALTSANTAFNSTKSRIVAAEAAENAVFARLGYAWGGGFTVNADGKPVWSGSEMNGQSWWKWDSEAQRNALSLLRGGSLAGWENWQWGGLMPGTPLSNAEPQDPNAPWNLLTSLATQFDADKKSVASATTAKNAAQATANSANATLNTATTGQIAAQAAVAQANAAQVAAQTAYATALRNYVADASKAVDKLNSLREATVDYYDAQKSLADGMLASSQRLRDAAAAMRVEQLGTGQTLAYMQSEFAKKYSLAISTTGTVQAGYADQMSAALPGLSAGIKATAGSRADWTLATAKLFAQSQAVADKLAANAPKDYQAESLALLGQIDGTLAAIEAATSSSEKIISDAIYDAGGQTLSGLRAVIAAIRGEPIPAFASGGMHAGGWRLVGENGPELEATGPARIFNASQTRAMLSGSNSSNADVVAELRALRADNAELRREVQGVRTAALATAHHTSAIARDTREWTDDGLTVKTDATQPLTVEALA